MNETKNGICHIVGAGDFAPQTFKISQGDFVIAADKGFLHLKRLGIRPNLAVGDFDSLGFCPDEVESVVLPAEKDDTDTLSAVKEGRKRGYRRFLFYGALGGKRFSHSLANLSLLLYLDSFGEEGEIIHENTSLSLLGPGTYQRDYSGGYFSLFPVGKEALVSVKGAKYPLENALLTQEFPLGVSNEGSAHTEISVHSGTLLLVREP